MAALSFELKTMNLELKHQETLMAKNCIVVFTAVLFLTLLSGPAPLLPGAQAAYALETKPAPGQPVPDKPKGKIIIKGGPGDTLETAFIISGAPTSQVGITAEYHVLEKLFGPRNVDWRLKSQSVLRQQGKVYDRMEVELKSGAQKTIFFDITEFFGKF
jgi:hypothetical protein